ncbi:hypothetical protein SUGI_0439870 [Cryptomeria japonica]|nr:hypothetical protein SUGI_0439870 [Cryptomeria japonica]
MRPSREETPLRNQNEEYVIDVDSNMWSNANFFHIMFVLSPMIAVGKWFNEICHWKNPVTTVLVHLLLLLSICYPKLILPSVFLFISLIGIWNFRFRPQHPSNMGIRLSRAEEVNPHELDEEFNPQLVRMRYERLRSVAGQIQTTVEDIATQGERFLSLLSWIDPHATIIFLIFCLFAAIVFYITPFRVVALFTGLYVFRHPMFRHNVPSVPMNHFTRLPARTDSMF